MSSSSTHSSSGRLWLVAMGLFLALAGAVFTWVLWKSWQRAEETRRWTPVPAVMTASSISISRPTPSANREYRVNLRYRYTWEGREMVGTHLKRLDAPTVHEERALEKVTEYPVGREVTCYVNPADPAQAILRHDTRAALYSIWFPLLFVVGGLGMARAALRKNASAGATA